MSEQAKQAERNFLASCFYEPEEIERALQSGVTSAHFTDPNYRELWRFVLELRTEGKPIDEASLYAEATARGVLPRIGGVETLLEATDYNRWIATTNLSANRELLLTLHAKRESWRVLQSALGHLKDNTASMAEVGSLVERVTEICRGHTVTHRTLTEVADEAITEAEEKIAGKESSGVLITTGIPSFDKWATPIEQHEYVVVGARTSHGKSSFMLQVAAHNLKHGLRVAIFTLETSDRAVLKQIAGQRAAVNVRDIGRELRDRQTAYLTELKALRECKNLLIFDRDTTLTSIQSRCRLLANSFKPNLVLIDYLGIVGDRASDSYERMSAISGAMIPLRKALGCTLMVAAQLNRSSEKEEREPKRSDFRDSGSLEDDAHRIIALWRKPNQALDAMWLESRLLQLKLRDGPLCSVDVKFHAPTTRFIEAAKDF